MYESFYNLSVRPFRLHPDPKFFFRGSSHRRAIAYLQLGLRFGEGFVIITGEVGTGKTTVAEYLLRQLNPEKLVAARVVATEFRSADLLPMIASSFNLVTAPGGVSHSLDSIQSFLRQTRASGKRVLLLVDEAQNLSSEALEELKALSDLHENGASLMQTFLLGQRELRMKLRSAHFETLRQRTTAAYHLSPLRPEETKAYIEHRLSTAGGRPEELFQPSAYERIHQATNGIPRRINRLCDRLLTYGCLKQETGLSAEAVDAVQNDLLEEERSYTVDDGLPAPLLPENPDVQIPVLNDPVRAPEGIALPEDPLVTPAISPHRERHQSDLTEPEESRDSFLTTSEDEPLLGEGERRLSSVEQQIKQLTEALTMHLAILQEERLQKNLPKAKTKTRPSSKATTRKKAATKAATKKVAPKKTRAKRSVAPDDAVKTEPDVAQDAGPTSKAG